MYFAQIYLRGQRQQMFTWGSPVLLAKGDRVEVPFRNRKRLGIVVAVSQEKPAFEVKTVSKIVHRGFIPASSVDLAEHIAQKHFTSVGKVLDLMVPARFLEIVNPVRRKQGVRSKNQNEKLKMKNEKCWKDSIRLGPKQRALLEMLEGGGEVDMEEVLKVVSRQTVKSLVEKGMIEIMEGGILPGRRDRRDDPAQRERLKSEIKLTDPQETAVTKIMTADKPVLLFGVTGSGKTEVYKEVLGRGIERSRKKAVGSRGGQGLVLVPEIALTGQLIASFEERFGERVAVWHSKMSDGEKIQEWARIQSGEASVVIGTRSAVLLPIPHLQTIIVDEEHEWTYKNEFAPRFWVKEVVEYLRHSCEEGSRKKEVGACPAKPRLAGRRRAVYGSATPSVESWYSVKQGEYELVELPHKVHPTAYSVLPTAPSLIDMRQEFKRGNDTPLSEKLVSRIEKTLAKKRQVVLFLNRRGFANLTMCQHCGHQFECEHCSVPMKLHGHVGKNEELRMKNEEWQNPKANSQSLTANSPNRAKLICHICGVMEDFPTKCPECSAGGFSWKGWGTQRVEQLLQERFPDKVIFRADSDTMSGKYDFDRMMEKFSTGKGDILLGTQMITKGLDFDKVDLVGILMADIGLGLPDFRAHERVFQQFIQVAGRTGRREHPGEILIQTFHPDLPIFEYVQNQDVQGFLEKTLQEREQAGYPPYTQIVKLIISDRDKAKAWRKMRAVVETLKKNQDPTPKVQSKDQQPIAKSQKPKANIPEILSAPAFWPKTHGKYHFHVFMKTGVRSQESGVSNTCCDKETIESIANIEELKVDIDPVSLL